ncbi:alpha/beta hydrolase [bacterium]|nr:MAG: alpha/beta hydrolase [bacterium]
MKYSTCDECGSTFKPAVSPMKNLCPNCAHYLYDYPNCNHDFENCVCTTCGWDGSTSAFVKNGLSKDMAPFKVYTIPGLGLDSRIFQQLDIPFVDLHHLNWIEPQSLKETIQDYAHRFSLQIDTSSSPVVLIGHSFGGVLAQEISKILPVSKIILISSITHESEKPFAFTLLKVSRLYKLVTPMSIWVSVLFWGYFFDFQRFKDLRFFQKIIRNSRYSVLMWSFKTIFEWKSASKITVPIVRIHGKLDRTFFIKKQNQIKYVIESGGHFLVFKRTNEINRILNDELAELHSMKHSP